MTNDSSNGLRVSRRQFLAGTGATGALALAGCLGGQSDGTNGTSSGSGEDGEKAMGNNQGSQTVKIAGSSTVYPISKAFAEDFMKKNRGAKVSVSSTGTGGGFANFFCVGKTDINDASRQIKEEERQSCESNDINPLEFQVATDALTVVANPNADWIDSLSYEELRQIFGPENTAQKWSDVRSDWPDKKINVYGASSASGTFDFFTETVMGEEGKHRTDYQGTEEDNKIVEAVSKDQYAIGYFGFSYYIENKDQLLGVPIKKGDGQAVKPSFETAKSGNYSLARPLFIYAATESLQNQTVYDFVKFYLEQSKTDAVKQIGYVPVKAETANENLKTLQSEAGK